MFESLFSNGSPLDRYVPVIERIVRSLGLDPERARIRLDDDRFVVWTLRRGSAEVEITLTADGWYRVDSAILELPADGQEAFFRHLLEQNGRLAGVSLCLIEGVVTVSGARPLEGMDAGEAEDLLHRVSRTADGLDDELHARFGAPLVSSPR